MTDPAPDTAPDVEERVLVIPRASILDAKGWTGVRAWDREAFEQVVRRDGSFERRSVAEQDPSRKQVIPYLVLRDGDAIFLMRRTRAGGDTRLHDRWTIGVGGHLNPGDRDLAGGLQREWAEEVVASFSPDFTFVGLLNDDRDAVGSVHVGAVFIADAGGRPVAIRETNKLEGGFVAASEVAAVHERLETWSALVFEHLRARGMVA